MAWIESHQSLLAHRKTVRAATLLKVDRYKFIGHLHALWWWALDNADDDGLLGDITPEELADLVGWPKRTAQQFVDALIVAGFLESSGGLRLHNWWKYAGKLNAKRTKDRERKAGDSAEVARNSSGVPAEVAGKSQAPTNLPTYQPTNRPNQPREQQQPIFALYEQTIGHLTPTIAQLLDEAMSEYSWTCISEHAFPEAARNNVRKWKYVEAILKSHAVNGCYESEGEDDNDGREAELQQRIKDRAAALDAR